MGNIKPDYYMDVPVKDIVSESNRKHGGMGNIDILAKSIKVEGLINPPTVVDCGDGTYRIIAGRRRIAAVRQLKWKEVFVRIIDESDADRLESIGLSENVNRQKMHPLDEAELFKKKLDAGEDIKNVAAYYDRSISGIHHRVRLCDLREELQGMFRDGRLSLSGAALIASLPDGNQEKFFKKYGEKNPEIWEINGFIHQVQHCTLSCIADKACEKCKKRTHNTTPGLFEDISYLEDVCLDGDCYAGKWRSLIAARIAQHEDVLRTENNIILSRSIPKFLPPKAGTVTLNDIEYTLLAPDKYIQIEAKKKTKGETAWVVDIDRSGVTVKRTGYKEYDRNAGYRNASSDPVKEFLIGQVPGVAIEDQKTVAEKVKEKYEYSWQFTNAVKQDLLAAIVSKRLTEETRENLAAAYLTAKRSIEDDDGKSYEIDPEYAGIFETIFSPDGITKFTDIPVNPLIQKLFLFLTATGINAHYLPDIDDSEGQWAENEKSLFWKFAQLTREEYISLYQGVLFGKINEAMEPNGETVETD
jgi:ParB/RepB/Spo0J family partition protein